MVRRLMLSSSHQDTAGGMAESGEGLIIDPWLSK